MGFDRVGYERFFAKLTGNTPYAHQNAAADALFSGRNVFLRAPTGTGKTLAALAPFLFDRARIGASRLIYALPLRSLVYAISEEARSLARMAGLGPEMVTIQTGEAPDDPFFDRGAITVTTYDQVLSGLLNAPYGLSRRLRNINAASLIGAMVVFDEFHLMETTIAFLTAVACLRSFGNTCRSMWMTATATSPLERLLVDVLNCLPVPASDGDYESAFSALKVVNSVTRRLVREERPLAAESVLLHHRGLRGCRSIVVMNRVARAQAMCRALVDEGEEPILLHSRFFEADRQDKQERILRLFGKKRTESAILVATQVVEAGLDITCDHLHTETCPASSLVQRAGRCARFEGESGFVHVYPQIEEGSWYEPYSEGLVRRTWDALGASAGPGGHGPFLDPSAARALVEVVHGQEDSDALQQGWRGRRNTCFERIRLNLTEGGAGVSDLIRTVDDSRVLLAFEPPENPAQVHGLGAPRRTLKGFIRRLLDQPPVGWKWDPADDAQPWKPIVSAKDIDESYCVCLTPSVAAYSSQYGLELGASGKVESPKRKEPRRPGHLAFKEEDWVAHSQAVARHAENRLAADFAGNPKSSLLRHLPVGPKVLSEAVRVSALLHDIGKLQRPWQDWAQATRLGRGESAFEGCAARFLAHTEHDSGSADCGLGGKPSVRRPPHSKASAYYAAAMASGVVPNARESGCVNEVISAISAAILSHHGGWLGRVLSDDIGDLCFGWEEAVGVALGVPQGQEDIGYAARAKDKCEQLRGLLDFSSGLHTIQQWWPVVAYLMRNLRLSDQHATAEGGSHE